MAGSRHREQRIIAAVPCSACGAAVGAPCRLRSEAERASDLRPRQRTHGCYSSEEAARLAPHQHGPAGERALAIQPDRAGELVVALTAAGLRVE